MVGPGNHMAGGNTGPKLSVPRKESKANCNLEQAMPPGRLCSSHLWFLKDGIFTWEKDSGHSLGLVWHRVAEFTPGFSIGYRL